MITVRVAPLFRKAQPFRAAPRVQCADSPCLDRDAGSGDDSTTEHTTSIYVAGTRTLVGAATVRRLQRLGHRRACVSEDEPDPRDRAALRARLLRDRPVMLLCAAGAAAGIAGNQRIPADLLLDNLEVVTSVIPAALQAGVERLLYLASSCVYPPEAPQPLSPASLWCGRLEETSRSFASARLAGIEFTAAVRRQHGVRYVTAIPADVFGPGAGDDEDAHVVTALIRRFGEARATGAPVVEVWGSGRPVREPIYADDVADACLHVLDRYDEDVPINIGSGWAFSVAEIAATIQDVVGYTGQVRFDTSRPDGALRKTLDSSALYHLGWRPAWSFRDGVRAAYEAFRDGANRAGPA
jgi:GDP-L-fucose synthase